MANSKILFILHVPPPVHGSSVVGSYIKQSLEINRTFDCNYINLGTSLTIGEIGKKSLMKSFRYFSIFFKLTKQLIFNKPELCYLAITAKGKAFYKDSVIALCIRLLGIPIVYHFHNKGVRLRQNKTLDNFLYQKVFNNSSAILLSKHLYTDVKKYFDPKNIHICPNGIPKTRNLKIDRKKNKKKLIRILFLSNLIESKGVKILLSACRIVKKRNLNFKCVFVGGEGDITKTSIETMIKEYGLEKEVIYKGKKYNNDKYIEFLKSDLFVLPTFYDNECFPLVLLEAMQASLPVISTPEGGIRDIVIDSVTGFLVDQKDDISLADKIEFLLNNPKIKIKMGINGRKRFENKFTLKIFEKI